MALFQNGSALDSDIPGNPMSRSARSSESKPIFSSASSIERKLPVQR